MYNGRLISKRIAQLLVVIVVRIIIAWGFEVLLSDAVPSNFSRRLWSHGGINIPNSAQELKKLV